jgi:hypothetical protein
VTHPDLDADAPRLTDLLDLNVVDSEAVVARVLTILCRRRCRLLKVDYTVSGHGRGRLIVEYTPPPRHGHSVAAWVGNLVEVLDVRSTAV